MASTAPAICRPWHCDVGGELDWSDARSKAVLFASSTASVLSTGAVRVECYPKRVSRGSISPAVAVRGGYELSNSSVVENSPADATVEIPVSCYQIIGVSEKAEKDEVVKAVMELKACEIEDGYTIDVIRSRQELLMDVRDKLLFEPEYAGSVKDKVPPKASLCIPWGWLPAALCLLLEVGEDKLAIDIGRAALEHQGSKLFAHDLLLSMALAECSIAKAAFEKNQVAQGFEALARSQYFLRSRSSSEDMSLLSQIEDSLEELAPACTLELLGMPQTSGNVERRKGALSALQELLRQGLEVETSCQVQDWPSFLLKALSRLTATETVDLISWIDLATTRKNKKSIESQNQRIIIDFNCFYMVMIAHVALGFSTRQKDLINTAKDICECLVASEGVDLKFEEAFCSLLLGQALDKEAITKLVQLQLSAAPASCNGKMETFTKETKATSSVSLPVETWLKESVLSVFPDTRDCHASLANFFGSQKRILGGSNPPKRPSRSTSPEARQRSLNYLSLDKKSLGDTTMQPNSMRQVGEAVKQLAPPYIGKYHHDDNPGNDSENPSTQGNSSLQFQHRRLLAGFRDLEKSGGIIAYVAVLGCITFSTLKLFGGKVWGSRPFMKGTCTVEELRNPKTSAESSAPRSLLLKLGKLLKKSEDQRPAVSTNVDIPVASDVGNGTICCREMPMQEAETLIRKWQYVKAEALGPTHRVGLLPDILAEAMLSEWKGLANSAKARSCFWRFVLLKLSILRADILSDGAGGEVAEIEVVIEEAAELVDESQPKNPNYYSLYKIRYILKKDQVDSWRLCEGLILEDSPSL
ncbi:plastid division protein [Wolffia australiana]